MSDLSSVRFLELLHEFKVPALLKSRDVIYGLWPDLSLAFTNASWRRFAADNAGQPAISERWGLGRCISDAIPEPLKSFYETNYRDCLNTATPWEHTYECSSVDTLRLFHMTALPIGKRQAILVVNSLRIETPMDRDSAPPLEATYLNRQGMMVQCAHCRRVRHAEPATSWDWVREWVRKPLHNTSHTICEPCLGFYYSLYVGGERIPKPISTIT